MSNEVRVSSLTWRMLRPTQQQGLPKRTKDPVPPYMSPEQRGQPNHSRLRRRDRRVPGGPSPEPPGPKRAATAASDFC